MTEDVRWVKTHCSRMDHGGCALLVGDITDIPEEQEGDDVELFGENISADEVAARLGTINYEVVCMVNKRVPRVYRFLGDERVENEILNDGWCGV